MSNYDDRWMDELDRNLQSYTGFHNFDVSDLEQTEFEDDQSKNYIQALAMLNGNRVSVTRSRSPRRT